MQFEADVFKRRRAGHGARLQHNFPRGFGGARFALIDVHLVPQHHFDQTLLVDLADGGRAHMVAVTQHDQAITDFKNFMQMMGDQDNRDPLLFQRARQIKQIDDLFPGEGGRGFVHDQQSGIMAERLCDLDQLLLGDTEGAGPGVKRGLKPEAAKQPGRRLPHRAPVKQAAPVLKMTQKDILDHRELGHDHQFLVNGADPFPARVQRLAEFDGLAVHIQAARAGPHGAGQDFHER